MKINETEPGEQKASRERGEESILLNFPGLSIVLGLLGILLFSLMAASYVNQTIFYQIDYRVLEAVQTFQETGPDWLLGAASAIGSFSNYGILIPGAVLGGYWLWKKCWRRFYLLLIGTGGGFLLFILLAQLFDRERPRLTGLLQSVPIPGFPSGHVINAVSFFSLLLFIFLDKVDSKGWRIVITTSALLMLVIIGASRIYLGAHYISDVIAGYGIGVAWVVLTFSFVDWYFLRRKNS